VVNTPHSSKYSLVDFWRCWW